MAPLTRSATEFDLVQVTVLNHFRLAQQNTGKNMKEIPKFYNVEDAVKALEDSDKFLPRDLYPRDSGWILHTTEERIGYIIGNKNVILYNSGMSAIRDSLEIANPGFGTKILRGKEFYGQTLSYIDDNLVKRGVRVESVDSGDIGQVEKKLNEFTPDIAIFETITNGENTSVLDLEKLFSLPVLRQTNPYLILDNTLPSSINNINSLLKNYPDRRVVIVESGTKFYSMNKELSGIVYSNNEEILNSLKALRRRTGSMPGVSSIAEINNVLPTKDEFDSRTKSIYKNTFRLAYALDYAAREIEDITISYPNLKSHKNSEYSNNIAPEGISPVLFANILNLEKLDYIDLVKKFWNKPEIRKYCDLGQSFGLDRTRIWFKLDKPYIRISGGVENLEDIKSLSYAFIKVLKGGE